jgi:nicotinamide riboside kinase
MGARTICLLGAESTGKTQLAGELAAHFTGHGLRAVVVAEVLREWCTRAGRTPRPEEQLAIAQEQERRVAAAAAAAELVVADTSALMVAIYSGMLFEDGALYRYGLERQAAYDATLVTGLDLPWVADGLQRVGAQVREPVDALVRSALQRARVPYQVIYGEGPRRLQGALAALQALGIATGAPRARAATRAWVWLCDKCSDPECEHRLFSR